MDNTHADELDRAASVEEAARAANIAAIRAQAGKRELYPIGKCHWCNEPTDNEEKLFCDGECADFHARKSNGRY